MNDKKVSREQLLRRQSEINDQLAKLSRDEQVELDRDPEEQAIQLEQHEVSIGLVDNLRRELAEIEGKLQDLAD